MNVSAFLGGNTTEHENFSAQGNDGRKTSKKKQEREFKFSDP